MKYVLRIVLFLGVLLLVTSGLVQAKEPAKTFCGNLSEADCTLLSESEAVMKGLDSHSFTLDMTLDMSGILNLSADKMTFHLTGSGATSVDQKAMPDMSKLDPATFAKDQKAIFSLIADAIPYVSADLQLSLSIPAQIRKLSGTAKLPETIKLGLRLVDGVIYVNKDVLALLMPQGSSSPDWMGVNLPDMIKALLKQPGFSASMGSMSSGASMGSNFAGMFSDPKVLAGFIKIERLADAEVNSHKVAVFKTTLDYPAMFEMPFMQDMIKQQIAASGTKMSDKDLKAIMVMVQDLAKNMQFSMTQNIDLESKYVHQTDMNMVFDLSSLKAQMGSAPVFTLSATVTQADFNSVPSITAPKGGVVIPVESIIPTK